MSPANHFRLIACTLALLSPWALPRTAAALDGNFVRSQCRTELTHVEDLAAQDDPRLAELLKSERHEFVGRISDKETLVQALATYAHFYCDGIASFIDSFSDAHPDRSEALKKSCSSLAQADRQLTAVLKFDGLKNYSDVDKILRDQDRQLALVNLQCNVESSTSAMNEKMGGAVSRDPSRAVTLSNAKPTGAGESANASSSLNLGLSPNSTTAR